MFKTIIFKFALLFLIFSSSCNIQKRRYSNGFYINTIAHFKENIHHQINEAEKKNTRKTVFQKSGHENLVSVSDTVDAIDNTIPVNSKIRKKTKHQQFFLVNDTLLKKPESHQKLATNKPVKPKLEMFSKLALIGMLFNLAIIITIPILVIFFTFPQVVIILILVSLFAPAVPLILALEGRFRANKSPEKYKWPNIANVIIIISIWMFIISLFYLFIFAFVAGVSVAG
jgi:hypothetical protein